MKRKRRRRERRRRAPTQATVVPGIGAILGPSRAINVFSPPTRREEKCEMTQE